MRANHRVAASGLATMCASGVALLFAQGGAPPVRVAGDAADVPMLMRAGQPAVEVTVNGKGPFTFAIDTAASGAARADAGLVASQSLQTVGEARASDGMGGVRMIPIVRLGVIGLGGVTWSDVEVPSRDYNTSPKLPRIDGILGIAAFAEFLLTLDSRASACGSRAVRCRRLTAKWCCRSLTRAAFCKSRSTSPANRWLPISTPATSPATPCTCLPPSLSNFPLPVRRATPASAPRSRNTIALKQVTLTAPIKIGAHVLASKDVIYADLFRTGNLGSNVLREFVVTIDQKNKRVKFERPEIVAPRTVLIESGTCPTPGSSPTTKPICSARGIGSGRGRRWARGRRASTAATVTRSSSGRPMRSALPSSATSTAGPATLTRCTRSVPAVCGNCSFAGVRAGALYKFELVVAGVRSSRADPFALAAELPPRPRR